MKHCIACGKQPAVDKIPLCASCYTDACDSDAALIFVIEHIEFRYTERIADLEQLLEEYKQENEEQRRELNRLEAAQVISVH